MGIIKNIKLSGRKHGDKAFVETIVVRDTLVWETQVMGEKWIYSRSFRISIIVAFPKQMNVFRFVLGIIQSVNASNVWIFDPRCVSSPIRSVGNQQ